MGNCIYSQRWAAKARSDAIDRQLEEDSRKLRNVRSILLLGSAGSGKSTVLKRINIHQGGFTDDHLMAYRLTIYRNTLSNAQAIVLAMRKIGLDWADPNNRLNADHIFDYRIESSSTFVFSSQIAGAIHQLWQDPTISELMDRSDGFHLMDNAVYFFTNVQRIGSPTYRPTEEDVLRAYAKSTGITEARFMMGQLQLVVFDIGGQRSERVKWVQYLESLTSIVFCSSLSEYDQVLPEDENQNRMEKSLILFESVVNSRWLLRTSVILLLTKIDVFRNKLPRVPLERCFPEYSGGVDINKATKFILWRFMQTNRARLSVYPHLPHIMDATSVPLICSVVKETIAQNVLRDSGIL